MTVTKNVSFIKNATLHGYEDYTHNRLCSFEESFVFGSEYEGYGIIKLYAGNTAQYELIFSDVADNVKYYIFYYAEDGSAVYPADEIIPKANSSYVLDVPVSADFVCINVYPADLEEGGEILPFVINEYSYRSFVR